MLIDFPLQRTKEDIKNLLEHRHPNSLQFDVDGRLYIGDSRGLVHVWDVDVLCFQSI